MSLVLIGVNVSAYYAGAFTKNREWKQELLNRSLAEYNSKTGNWQYVPIATYTDLFGQEPPLPVKDGNYPDHSLPQKVAKK